MSLRTRLLLAIAASVGLVMVLIFWIGRAQLLGHISAHERNMLRSELLRVDRDIDDQLATLARTAADWGEWDDAYRYLGQGNPDFADTNLVAGVVSGSNALSDVLFYLDVDRHFVAGLSRMPANRWPDPVPVTREIAARVAEALPGNRPWQGLLRVRGQTLMLAVSPVLRSDGTGPSRGTLATGRWLDQEKLTALGARHGLVLQAQPWEADAVDGGTPHTDIRAVEGGRALQGTLVVGSAIGTPAIALAAQVPRPTYAAGQRLVGAFLVTLALLGLLLAILLTFLFQHYIVNRLQRANRAMMSVTFPARASHRFDDGYHDELSLLLSHLDRMLQRLQRSEQEVLRAERAHAFGELAAAINHNLNNLLVGVIGGAELIEQKSRDGQIKREAMRVRRIVGQVSELIRQLGASTRQPLPTRTEPVDVNEVIHTAVEATRPRWQEAPHARGYGIDMVLDLASDLPAALASPTMLAAVLLELIANAVRSLPEGGEIHIASRRLTDNGSGQGVEISVGDRGIESRNSTDQQDSEPDSRIWQDDRPGIDGVAASIRQWHGEVRVASASAQGTTVVITLPAAPPAQTTDSQRELSPPHRARLLLVDDQEYVGEVLRRRLQDQYEMECKASAEAALASFQPGSYDVALIDLALPGRSGDLLARELRQADPNLGLVLITGWQLDSDDPRLQIFDALAAKPFSDPDLLRNAIAEALARRDQRAAANAA